MLRKLIVLAGVLSQTACTTVTEDICDRYDECSLSYEDESSVAGCEERLQNDFDTFENEFGEDAMDELESALGTCPDEDTCEDFDLCTKGVIGAAVIGNCPDWPSCSGLLD